MLRIQNTLTRQKEEFIPQEGKKVKMYTCGVTVYDDCHIGHARSLYSFEVIRSYLVYRGYKVDFVRNITDIDDKIINRANELKIDWKKLVDKYITRYYEDLQALGIERDYKEPRATDNIAEMIEYVQKLIDKGYAYVTDSGVYFSVRKLKGYGKLSGQSIDDIMEGVRIQKDEHKQDPLDFALWKAAKEGEPYWESPWGKGRPGWHIECSVMSQKYLNSDTLDIHGGGRDLVFPHHENEIAQAEALTGKPFAKYWIHHGLLSINAQKMSKSLGNFLTIKNVLKQYPADVLKLFYLHAHYASTVDFSRERMEEARKAYERIDILLGKLDKIDNNLKEDPELSGFKQQFVEAMDDDFNMPKGLAVLFDIVSECNKILESNSPDKNSRLGYAKGIIKQITAVFGLSFKKKAAGISDQEIERMIARRIECKQQKDYQAADNIRKELQEKGIILEDSKEGTTWRRKV